MRISLLALIGGVGVLLGGCAHLSAPAQDNGWTAKAVGVGASHAKATPATVESPNWSPIKTSVLGKSWADDLVVTKMTDAGPHAVAHADGPYLLDSGDQLRIFVYGQPNLSRIYRVDHAGNIMMPLIGLVRAQRRTPYHLAGVIRGALAAKYVRDPQVTVDIHQNRPFFILGEVRQPGQYPYVNGMTVETAVAIAGGYSPRASHRRFRISRRVDGVVEVAHGTGDYVIRPGDTIKVSERFF